MLSQRVICYIYIISLQYFRRGAKMRKCFFLVILSIFLFSNISFAGSIETASHQQIRLIKQGFFEPVVVLKSAAMIRGDSRYYVGLNFLAKGYETSGIGIWIVEGHKSNPSKVYAVNATASIFSGYVNTNQKLAASMSNPKAKMILNYLKRK
jgi:hypothetical protein